MSRPTLTFIFLISLCAVSFAYGAEIFFNIKPCALCYWQRYLYIAIALIAMLFHLLNSAKGVLLSSGLFFVNAGVAFYQVLIEFHLIEAPAFCKKMGASALTLEELRQQLTLNSAFVPPCDVVSWKLFGLSMATYNMFFSFVMGVVFAYYYFCRLKKRKHGR